MSGQPPRRFSLEGIKRLFGYSSATFHGSDNIERVSEGPEHDLTKFNLEGDNLLHALVKEVHKDPHQKQKRLVTLLCQSHLYINLHNKHGETALHLATQLQDTASVKTLLVFRANTNVLNWQHKTPLDTIEAPPALSTLRSQSSANLQPRSSTEGSHSISSLLSLYGGMKSRDMRLNDSGLLSNHLQDSEECDYYEIDTNQESIDYIDQLAKQYSESESKIKLQLAADTQPSTEDDLVLAREMRRLKVLREGGSRVLMLDGGGMGGLCMVETLMEIEQRTGKNIVELFDWVVGTSCGAMIAAGVVQGLTLKYIRQYMYERIEKSWFSHRLGLAFNTPQLESDAKLEYGDRLIDSVKYPRLLIPAVNKTSTPLKLEFFNNCFDDEFSKVPLWKVLRYTSAAPMFFKELDGYCDGGVLANNPGQSALTRIHSFYQQRNERLPISLVVSLGRGKPPPKPIGNVDCQDFLYLGSHWLYTDTTFSERAKNLSKMFSEAILRTEAITANCRSRCEEQGIPFYRFSPQLEEEISLGETNFLKLIDMLVTTKKQTLDSPELSELVEQLLKYPAAKQRALQLLHSQN